LICYNFVKHLPYIKFHVISPNVDIKCILRNVKIYDTKGYPNPFDPTVFKAVNFALRSYSASKSILNRENVDIIHHFLPVQHPHMVSFLPFDKSIMKRYPLVIGPISFPTYWPSKGFEKLMDFLSKPLFKKCLQEADAIITQTKRTRELIKDVVHERDVTVIPPGVDVSIFRPVKSPVDKLEILTVGNLLPQKGMEYLIRAISYVKKDFPDVVLRIVGKGSHGRYLRALSNSLGFSRNVIFEDFVSKEELVKLYNQATIFCSPSLVEPFGVVMLEAMACGKPIVATKTVGATEIIRHEEEGFLVQTANPKLMANSILTLLNRPDLVKSMGAKAMETCLKKYSWSAIAKIYSRIYSSILGA